MPIVPRGYLEWGTPAGTLPYLSGAPGGVVLDGVILSADPTLIRWQRQADTVSMRAGDGSHVVQARAIGPDAPAGVSPFRGSIDVQFIAESDLWAIEEAYAAERAVLWYPRWWQVDVWHVPGGGGRTTWRTSRRLPYQVAGVTASNTVAVALVDGVALDPVSSGPGAGEVVIPTTLDGQTTVIETAGLGAALRLVLRYPAEYWVRVANISHQVSAENDLRATLDLEEQILGRWEAW